MGQSWRFRLCWPARNAKSRDADAVFWRGLTDQAITLAQTMHRQRLDVTLLTGTNGIVGPLHAPKSGFPGKVIALEMVQPLDKLKEWKPSSAITSNASAASSPPARRSPTMPPRCSSPPFARSIPPIRPGSRQHCTRSGSTASPGPNAFDDEGDLRGPRFSMYALQNGQWQLLQTIVGK